MDLLFGEEAKSVWQRCADEAAGPRDWQTMLGGLREYETRVSRINRGKSWTALTILLLAFASLLPGHLHSWMVPAGLAWIGLSVSLFIVLHRRWQFRAEALPLDRNTLELIGFVREALHRERRLFFRALPLLCASIVAGLQLISLDVLRTAPVPDRVVLHTASVLAVAAVLAGGLRFRSRRFKREMKPLLDRLAAFEQGLR
jgi:hypothetical protein